MGDINAEDHSNLDSNLISILNLSLFSPDKPD